MPCNLQAVIFVFKTKNNIFRILWSCRYYVLLLKINHFRGNVTDVSAKTKALLAGTSYWRYWSWNLTIPKLQNFLLRLKFSIPWLWIKLWKMHANGQFWPEQAKGREQGTIGHGFARQDLWQDALLRITVSPGRDYFFQNKMNNFRILLS